MIELNVLNNNAIPLDIADDALISLEIATPTGGGTINNQDKSVNPTESQQIVTADEGYTGLGEVTVGAISSSYVGSGIARRTVSDLSASGGIVSVPSGYYELPCAKGVPMVSMGTPTASKGAVSNHSIAVTPSVTNQEGYIEGGTVNGSAVYVNASELVSGTKEITANGNDIDVTNYATANVAVPNTYTASDEGKVVSSGALVAQTSDTVTVNDTYDTTLINSLTVNVSGGGGFTSGTFTPTVNTASATFDTGLSTMHGFLIIPTENPNNAGASTLKIYTVWAEVDNPPYIKMMCVRGKTTSERGFEIWVNSTPPFSITGSVVSISFNSPSITGYFSPVTYKWYAW